MGLTNYGFFTRFRQEEQQQSQVAFLPCAPGCRGSNSDPRHCQCVCRGINHGLLLRPVRIERPVPVPYGYNPSIPLQQLPELIPHLEEKKPETESLWDKMGRPSVKDPRPFSERHTTTRKIGHSFKVAMTGRSESELNEGIMSGLRKQFSEERVSAIIDESFSEHYSRMPDSNRPELYELFESGFVDNVLDRRGIRWVIGRPKRK